MTNLEIAKQIVDLLGGKENVSKTAHCMTRLRVSVKDVKRVDQKGLKNLDGVLGLVQEGEAIQIVLGPGKVKKVTDLSFVGYVSGVEARKCDYEKNLAYLREKLGDIQICEPDRDKSFSEEELGEMRAAGGVVLSLPFGAAHGSFVSYVIEQLKVQDCALCGVAIRDADERFLRRYYGRTFFARGNGGEM